jgi:hypothetical protein
MDDKLLTQKDLAQRWQMSIRAIEEYRKSGIIPVVEGIPAIRFNPKVIIELEGTKLDKFSPLERRRLEREIERLKQENEHLKSVLSRALADLAPVINL